MKTSSVPQPGYVYAIRARNGGIKIGCTIDVARRLVELNRGRRLHLVVLATAFCSDYQQAEKWVHRLLEEYRLSGEWFSCSDEEAITAVQVAGDKP